MMTVSIPSKNIVKKTLFFCFLSMFFYFSTVSARDLNDNEKEAERDFNYSLAVLAKKLNTSDEQAWEILQKV